MAERVDASSSDAENTNGGSMSDDDTNNIPFTKNKGNGRAQVYTVAQLARWHPRVKTEDFPPWVHDCKVVNFDGGWESETSKRNWRNKVNALYLAQFENTHDRTECQLALKGHHTFALYTPGMDTAISSITFARAGKSLIVMFLATSSAYVELGMASFLMQLVLEDQRVYLESEKFKICLKVNRGNTVVKDFYHKRGFRTQKKAPTLCQELKDLFDKTRLKKYPECHDDLEWMVKNVKDVDFVNHPDFESNNKNARNYTRFFTDPVSKTTNLCTYAPFPQGMLLEEANHCSPTTGSTTETAATMLLDAIFCHHDGDGEKKCAQFRELRTLVYAG